MNRATIKTERVLNGRTFVLLSVWRSRKGLSQQLAQYRLARYIPPEKKYRDEYSGLWWVCED